ncbi:MAG: GNAT family N-acetyltransferase [Pseudomonadota bacterium]
MIVSSEAPFSAPAYRLPNCTLCRLEEEDQALSTVSRALAGMEPWLTLGYTHEGLHNYLVRPDSALMKYLVSISGEAAGLVCIRYPWLRGPCLELLAVFDEHQGRGTGTQILRWIEEQVRSVSDNLWVLVSSFNAGALKFYQSQGFVKIGAVPDLVKPGYDEIVYRKTL